MSVESVRSLGRSLVLVEAVRVRAPGLAVSAVIAMASFFVSDHYGGPTLLFALLIGMAFHFLSEEGRCVPGIEFAARALLRFGVALLGARITAEQIGSLGAAPVLLVVGAVAATIAFGRLCAGRLGLSREQGLLSGGAVAICGASAALALAAVMPRHEHAERDTILTVVGVTTLSTLAMILYPLLVGALDLDPSAAGIFLGGTIHDVAQVVGAGYMISPQTGDVATFVKLLRVAMLVPAVLAFSLLFRRADADAARGRVALPGFLLGFVALVIANSLGWVPKPVAAACNEVSRWCLVVAIAALGIKTSFQRLAVVGWRPVLLMVLETLFLAILVLGVVLLMSS